LENVLANFGAELVFDSLPTLLIRTRHIFFLWSDVMWNSGGTDGGTVPVPLRAVTSLETRMGKG
jgi:hypothetical protein